MSQPLRTQEQIQGAFDQLVIRDVEMEDTFQYGYLEGKRMALLWVLGFAPGCEVSSDFNFEDWWRTMDQASPRGVTDQ
jgi:hypothetical protein